MRDNIFWQRDGNFRALPHFQLASLEFQAYTIYGSIESIVKQEATCRLHYTSGSRGRTTDISGRASVQQLSVAAANASVHYRQGARVTSVTKFPLHYLQSSEALLLLHCFHSLFAKILPEGDK